MVFKKRVQIYSPWFIFDIVVKQPSRDISLLMQDAPDINVILPFDVEHQIRKSLARPTGFRLTEALLI